MARLNIYFKRKTLAEERPSLWGKCSSLWEKYWELQRKTKSIIHAKCKKFFESLPALLSSSTKKFWSGFKSVSKHSNVPNRMTWSQPDSVKYSANNPSDIANLLNQYFYSVFKPSDSSDDEMSFPNSNVSYSDTSEGTISSITLTPEKVYHILVALDENKVTGPDKIPAKRLKNCACIVCSSLCVFFNKSLSSGKLLHEWKHSNIIPIPKKGPAEDVLNYRPISLFSLVSKVFNAVSTINSYPTFPLNSTIYNSVSSEASPPPHSYCMSSRISTKHWRIEAKLRLSTLTVLKRSTRLVTISC